MKRNQIVWIDRELAVFVKKYPDGTWLFNSCANSVAISFFQLREFRVFATVNQIRACGPQKCWWSCCHMRWSCFEQKIYVYIRIYVFTWCILAENEWCCKSLNARSECKIWMQEPWMSNARTHICKQWRLEFESETFCVQWTRHTSVEILLFISARHLHRSQTCGFAFVLQQVVCHGQPQGHDAPGCWCHAAWFLRWGSWCCSRDPRAYCSCGLWPTHHHVWLVWRFQWCWCQGDSFDTSKWWWCHRVRCWRWYSTQSPAWRCNDPTWWQPWLCEGHENLPWRRAWGWPICWICRLQWWWYFACIRQSVPNGNAVDEHHQELGFLQPTSFFQASSSSATQVQVEVPNLGSRFMRSPSGARREDIDIITRTDGKLGNPAWLCSLRMARRFLDRLISNMASAFGWRFPSLKHAAGEKQQLVLALRIFALVFLLGRLFVHVFPWGAIET